MSNKSIKLFDQQTFEKHVIRLSDVVATAVGQHRVVGCYSVELDLTDTHFDAWWRFVNKLKENTRASMEEYEKNYKESYRTTKKKKKAAFFNYDNQHEIGYFGVKQLEKKEGITSYQFYFFFNGDAFNEYGKPLDVEKVKQTFYTVLMKTRNFQPNTEGVVNWSEVDLANFGRSQFFILKDKVPFNELKYMFINLRKWLSKKPIQSLQPKERRYRNSQITSHFDPDVVLKCLNEVYATGDVVETKVVEGNLILEKLSRRNKPLTLLESTKQVLYKERNAEKALEYIGDNYGDTFKLVASDKSDVVSVCEPEGEKKPRIEITLNNLTQTFKRVEGTYKGQSYEINKTPIIGEDVYLVIGLINKEEDTSTPVSINEVFGEFHRGILEQEPLLNCSLDDLSLKFVHAKVSGINTTQISAYTKENWLLTKSISAPTHHDHLYDNSDLYRWVYHNENTQEVLYYYEVEWVLYQLLESKDMLSYWTEDCLDGIKLLCENKPVIAADCKDRFLRLLLLK